MDMRTQARRAEDAKLLRDSLALLAPVADHLIAEFYGRLFARYPQVRSMFPAILDWRRERLLKATIALVMHYDKPDTLLPALSAMGRSHVYYGAGPEHYRAIGQTLLDTLAAFIGDAWTPELAAAWERAYTFAAGVMLSAAKAEAEAVASQRRSAA